MDWQNLIVQLGISGLVVYVVFRIGMKLIENMRVTDSERTEAIRQGFAADIAAHHEITKTMSALGNQFSRVEGKLDSLLDLTPVREMRAAHDDHGDAIPRRKIPSVLVDLNQLDEEDDTPVDRPDRQTPPPKGVQKQSRPSSIAGIYGPKKP